MLLEPTCIDRLDAPVNTVNGDLRWSKPNDGAKSLMRSLNGPIIPHREAPPEHP